MKSSDEILDILIHETGIILPGRAETSPDAALSSLGFDSLSFVELLIAAERHFGVKLIEGGMGPEDMKSLQSLALCIHRSVSAV